MNLQDLVEGFKAIFLLIGTREFRWLLAVMSRALGTTLINSTLGLDSCISMRHGVSRRASDHLGYYLLILQEIHAQQDR